MTNSADPDQLASDLDQQFAKEGISGFSRTRVKILSNRVMTAILAASSQYWEIRKKYHFLLKKKAHYLEQFIRSFSTEVGLVR